MPIAPKRPPTIKPSQAVGTMNLLVFSYTGAGKTTLLGSMAKDPEGFGKILLLCPDPGLLTLAFDEDANRQIEAAPIRSLADLDTWYEFLHDMCAKQLDPAKREFQTLAIDGFTDIGELALREALDAIHDRDSNRDPDQPGIDHWNRVGIVVRRCIRQFRDLPMTFFATALAKDTTDKDGTIFTTPSLPGKLAAELGAYVDIIAYLYCDQDKTTKLPVRKLRTERTDRIQAKDRTRRLPTIIENPTMPSILNMIRTNPQRDAGLTDEVIIRMKKAQVK